MNKSLVILKPDFFENNLYEEFLNALNSENILINNSFYISFTLNDVKNFYKWERLYNIDMMFKYWCNRTHPVLDLYGNKAITKTITIKKFFRSKYCKDCHEMYTLIHCPDTSLDYEREINFLLSKKILV